MHNLTRTSFLNALGIVMYIVLVSTVMTNGEQLFGDANKYVGPIAFLSLFTLSATVVGGLVLGKPLMLYLDNKKREAVSLFLQTTAWLAGFTVIFLTVLALVY